MKKMLAIILAVALVASLCTTAFAADAVKDLELGSSETNANYDAFTETDAYVVFGDSDVDTYDDAASTTQTVTLTVNDPHYLVEEFDVVVEFDELDFVYDWGANATWNEDTHEYDVGADAKWTDPQNIVVTNHSNRAVDVAAAFEVAAAKTVTKDGITATISASDATLDSADIDSIYGNPESADTLTYTVTVSGKPISMDDATSAVFGTQWVIDTVVISLSNGEVAP